MKRRSRKSWINGSNSSTNANSSQKAKSRASVRRYVCVIHHQRRVSVFISFPPLAALAAKMQDGGFLNRRNTHKTLRLFLI